MARRNRLEILGCILDICRGDGSSKTKVVYQLNLNFRNAGIYLEWLTKHGHLAKVDRLYRITPSGQRLLEDLNDINSMINCNIGDSLAKDDE